MLPTLNNLLENREMALEDGRFLMKQETYDACVEQHTQIQYDGTNQNPPLQFVPVHPNFHVVAIGLPVPPYPGRTIDPPLRSRFQCRYIDDLAVDTIASNYQYTSLLPTPPAIGNNNADNASNAIANLRRLTNYYETLKDIRSIATSTTASKTNQGNSAISGIPFLSLSDIQFALRFLSLFPNDAITLRQAVALVLPATDWLQQAIPHRFKAPLEDAKELLGLADTSTVMDSIRVVTGMGGKAGVNGLHLQSITLSVPHTANASFVNPHSEDVVTVSLACGPAVGQAVSMTNTKLLPSQRQMVSEMVMSHAAERHLCLLGPKV